MRFLARSIPAPFRRTAGDIWKDLQKALSGYLRAQFIMISITAFIVLIGLLILGVESAFTYALLIGLVDLLPYLGVGTIMIPWLIYAFATGDMTLGIGLSVLYGIILVARQLIEPKVLASSVGLDPLPTLIAMFAGLEAVWRAGPDRRARDPGRPRRSLPRRGTAGLAQLHPARKIEVKNRPTFARASAGPGDAARCAA